MVEIFVVDKIDGCLIPEIVRSMMIVCQINIHIQTKLGDVLGEKRQNLSQ